MVEFQFITTLLCSNKKLDRDRGVTYLEEYLKDADADSLRAVESTLSKLLDNQDEPWESKHGALLGIRSVVHNMKCRAIDCEAKDFLSKVCSACLELLTHSEVRIRLSAGDVIGSVCGVEGPEVYERCKGIVMELIQSNLERDFQDSNSEISDESDDYRQMSPTLKRRSSDASQIFHDTAGWKFLETSMKCLQCMIDGCGENFKPWINEDLLNLLFRTLTHTNRFVRETGYYLVGSLVTCATSCIGSTFNPFEAKYFGHQVAKQLGIGMGDNWSQVRLASSEGARKFLLSFKTDEEKEEFFPELLPCLCLNRYYIADGVRIYSQESWKLIAKTEGRDLVKKYISYFVDYYISQTKADNHAVREAACACIAELASKIDPKALKPYVSKLLQTLLDCFGDDSWPVRDAACLACGNFILCYPKESRSFMDSLYPLFFANLKDGIPSVRQGAAGALANVVKAYGDEAYLLIEEKIKSGLTGVKDQPSESEKYGQLDRGPATFSVVKKLRDNDMELHTDKQMYSCGSLAPKMGRGGGCSDHKFKKPSEPWELADGCVHLVAELAQIQEVQGKIMELLSLVAEAATYKHYTHHVCLLESLCKQLPNVAKGVGKRQFKQCLELFLEHLFYSLTCENILTSSAASQSLSLLSNFLGPNIFRSRVEQWNPSYLHVLSQHLET